MAPCRPTSATYFCTCASTCARVQSGHLLRTAKAMLLRTLSQGISAWPWKTTPRSRLGPATSRRSMNTWPSLAVSSPASTFRMVVLPQPLWPMMQTNSPCAIEVDAVEHRLGRTGVGLAQALDLQEFSRHR
jgi:hypothetical protein